MLLWKKMVDLGKILFLVETSLPVSVMLVIKFLQAQSELFIKTKQNTKIIPQTQLQTTRDGPQSSHWLGHSLDLGAWSQLKVPHPEPLGTPWCCALFLLIPLLNRCGSLTLFPRHNHVALLPTTANCSALCIFGVCQYPNLSKLEMCSKEEIYMG